MSDADFSSSVLLHKNPTACHHQHWFVAFCSRLSICHCKGEKNTPTNTHSYMNSHKHGLLCETLHIKWDTRWFVLWWKWPWLELWFTWVLERQKIQFICDSNIIPLFLFCDGVKDPHSSFQYMNKSVISGTTLSTPYDLHIVQLDEKYQKGQKHKEKHKP